MAKKTSCKWNAVCSSAGGGEPQKKQTTRRRYDNRQRQLQFDERHQKFYDPLMNEPNKNYMPHKPDDWSRRRYSPKGQSEGKGKEAWKGFPVSPGKLRRRVIIATACGCVCKWHMAMPRAVAPLETTSISTWTWTSAEVATIKQSWNRPPPAAADGEKSRNEIIINSAR